MAIRKNVMYRVITLKSGKTQMVVFKTGLVQGKNVDDFGILLALDSNVNKLRNSQQFNKLKKKITVYPKY